jgi:hypothetical protein
MPTKYGGASPLEDQSIRKTKRLKQHTSGSKTGACDQLNPRDSVPQQISVLHPSTPQTSLPQFMIIITLFILWFIL